MMCLNVRRSVSYRAKLISVYIREPKPGVASLVVELMPLEVIGREITLHAPSTSSWFNPLVTALLEACGEKVDEAGFDKALAGGLNGRTMLVQHRAVNDTWSLATLLKAA